MKKVLIISHSFSKSEPIARIQGMAKYLPQFDWDPTLLTYGDLQEQHNKKINNSNSNSNFKKLNVKLKIHNMYNIHNKNLLIENAIKIYKAFFLYPDQFNKTRREAINKGKNAIQNDHFDAIISSAHPVSSHIIASALVKYSNIPWIADFRDLWTQNHYYTHCWIRKLFETRLEKRTLQNADAIVTVSEPLSKEISQMHSNCPVYTIHNGFDPDQINMRVPVHNNFTITYTGTLYKGRRDPNTLFKAIRDLIDHNLIPEEIITTHFFCKKEKWLLDAVRKHGLENIVFIHGRVSREISIEKQKESQILLLLTWDNPKENGVYTSKVFEYLAAGRPILSMGYTKGGIVKDLLDQTQAGVHILNEEELKKYLIKAYHEYKEYGVVEYQAINSVVMKYSHKEMARKFAEVLNKISK